MIKKTYPLAEKLIKKGLDLSLGLLDLLKQEANNLSEKANATALSVITVQKKDKVSQLDLLVTQLAQVLETEQLLISSEGLTDYFNKADIEQFNTSETKTHWQQILTIAKQCQVLNEQNGASIRLLAQHTQHTLDILKGKSQNITTYNSDGSTYKERLSNPLTSI